MGGKIYETRSKQKSIKKGIHMASCNDNAGERDLMENSFMQHKNQKKKYQKERYSM